MGYPPQIEVALKHAAQNSAPCAGTIGKEPGPAQYALLRLDQALSCADRIENRLRAAMDYVEGPRPTAVGESQSPTPEGLLGGIHVTLDAIDRKLEEISSQVARLERVVG